MTQAGIWKEAALEAQRSANAANFCGEYSAERRCQELADLFHKKAQTVSEAMPEQVKRWRRRVEDLRSATFVSVRKELEDIAIEAIPAMASLIEAQAGALNALANAAEAVVNGEFEREASERADALFACLEQALAEARAALGRAET